LTKNFLYKGGPKELLPGATENIYSIKRSKNVEVRCIRVRPQLSKSDTIGTVTENDFPELTKGCYSGGDSQGLQGWSNPRILEITTISFQYKLYSQRPMKREGVAAKEAMLLDV